MQNPYPINLMTPEEVQQLGWAAEGRDEDGHLMTMNAPFSDADEQAEFLNYCDDQGWKATVFHPATPST